MPHGTPTTGLLPMKNSLRILVAVASLAVAAPAYAQGGGGGGGGGMGGPRMSPEERKAKMFEGITLTADQQTKIDTAMAQSAKKQAELRASMQAGGDRQAMMGQMRDIQTEQTKAIKAVLTAEQAVIFDKNMEALQPRRPGN